VTLLPSHLTFRLYASGDLADCLRLFDANCPAYFAPNERADYAAFVTNADGEYQVCLLGGQVVGAYGVLAEGRTGLALRWIVIAPEYQGRGVGSAIMQRVIAAVRASGPSARLYIGASHLSAPFFARFGAREVETILHGWGPDMHRVDMELVP
jgi:GNAT superfamily N-acetyltransferase